MRVTVKMNKVISNEHIVILAAGNEEQISGTGTSSGTDNKLTIGATIGVVVLFLIGGVAIILLAKKFKCCQSKNATINEQEMNPLRTTGRPLPLAQFRQRNDPCRPTNEEFEKMENDARNRNISKSYSTAMQFVRSKTPINRYFQLNALDENANVVCVSSLLSHF